MHIPLIKLILYYYRIFKQYTGEKLYLLIGVIITGGLTEGIGIALFLPLLALSTPSASSSEDTINIYFYRFLEFLHIQPTFNSILFLIVLVFLIKAIITLIQEALSSHISSSLTRDLRYLMINAYSKMKYSYYLNSNIGYLNNIITKEIERAVAAFAHYAAAIVAFIYILIYAIASIIVSWQVSILALLSGAVLVYSLKVLNDLSRRYSLLESAKNASLQEFLIQAIHYFKYLKATDTFKRIRPKLDNEIKSLADCIFKLGMFSGSLKSLKEPLTIFFLASLLFYQVSIMGKTIADIMVIILLFYRLVTKIFTLQYTWQKFNATVGGIDTFVKAFEEINRNKEIKGTKKVEQLERGLSLKNVNFSFGDKQILSDINMIVPKNRITAIVGESGSGKSTLVDLITSILTPTSGDIYFDNLNYKDLDLESVRLMIGYVTQENVVFHDSIANNISLWKYQENDPTCLSKVDKAARIAHCYEFVQDTESDYRTIVGDMGIKLSGGQRQRLAIAREIFKEPEILIMDEATSSLDSESEFHIQRNIEQLKGSRTIIIIAHRLSTITNCDYIYAMNKGRIVEEGTYDELYNGNTKFRKMCLEQQLSLS